MCDRSIGGLPNGFVQIGERDIFYLKDSACTGEWEFFRNRPLLCISVEERVGMASVAAVTMGSKGAEPGIVTHLQYPRKTEYIGDYDTTYIYPWTVFTFDPKLIDFPVIGKLKKEIFCEVRKCVAYHLGFSKEVPEYLKQREINVEYHYGTWDGEGVVTTRPQIPVKETKPEKPKVDNQAPKTIPVEPPKPTPAPITPIPQPKPTNTIDLKEVLPPKPTEPKKPRFTPMNEAMTELFAKMGETEAAMILARAITIGDLADKYQKSKGWFYTFRAALEDKFVTRETYKRIRGRVWQKSSNVKFLSVMEEVILACFMTADMAGLTFPEYNQKTQQIRKKYGIKDPSQYKPHWKGREAVMEKALPGCLTKAIAKDRDLRVIEPIEALAAE